MRNTRVVSVWRQPLLLLLFGSCAVHSAAVQAEWLYREESIMGTRCAVELWATDRNAGNAAIEAVFADMRRIDALMSTYKPDSEVSRVNDNAAKEPVAITAELFGLLQAKDLPGLQQRLVEVAEPVRSALLALPELYGGAEVLELAARRLPQTSDVAAALSDLRGIAAALQDMPLSFDLADLRGFNYHSGVVFAAYCDGHPAAVALGGRYDRVGKAFGRGRAATGFSLDLRELARLADWEDEPRGILAPAGVLPELQQAVAELRAKGEIVMLALPGHEGTWSEAGCNRQLILRGGRWCVEPLEGE